MYVQIISDVHLSDHAPVNCTDSYTDDLFDLLSQTVEIAKHYKAVTVFSGDIFHLKMPSRNSHALVQRAIDLINSYPLPVYIVPGNHDLMNDRLETLVSQPVGVLLKSGAQLLKGWAGESSTSDFPIYGVPWLQRFNDATVYESLKEFKRLNEKRADPALVVTHAPLYPLGKELPYENYSSSSWARAMGNSGSVAYGHVHDFYGTWTVDGVEFCNSGALSRGSLTESNRTRQVCTILWSSINGEFKIVPLKAKPASEVFKLEKVDKAKQLQVKLDDFLSAIGQTSIKIVSVDSVLAHVKSLGLDDKLTMMITELLHEVTEN